MTKELSQPTRLSQKLSALRELFKIAHEGSFDTYATSGDIYGERTWSTDCFEPLRRFYSKKITRQQALDETLMNLSIGDFPKTQAGMNQEKDIIHLTLAAGANPNYSNNHRSVFESFWKYGKGYGLLELAQDKRFTIPSTLQEFYKDFHFVSLYGESSVSELELNKKENQYRSELIYTLFQKNMYPTQKNIFENLSPIVLQKAPQFFDKKKQEVQHSLNRAKTPIQIYSVLTGQKKERN